MAYYNYNKNTGKITTIDQKAVADLQNKKISKPTGMGKSRKFKKLKNFNLKKLNFKKLNLKRINLKKLNLKLNVFETKINEPQKKAGKKPRRYKLLPLLASGLIAAAVALMVSIFVYSIFCYFTNNSGNGSVIAPTIIYMLAIITGSFFVSAIIHQRSIIPACLIGLIFFGLSLVFSLIYFDISSFKLSKIPLKLLFTILPALFGFLLSTIPNFLADAPPKRS